MDQVAQIREKINIVALISEYLPLKQMGRNFKRNCPFHNEKTPSFVVSAERQIWKCFGCGKGGDCFTFLMEYENLEFPEALRILAKKAGVELKTSHFETGISSQKETIYKMNLLAAEFYHYLLTKHNVGKKAYQYLTQERKIKPQVIETFMLGFSPNIGRILSEYLLKKKGFSKKDLITCGLSFERRGEIMDFFTGRLMFPLSDHRDNIVGFSGRIFGSLDSKLSSSKYVNTRETLVYHKGSTFFGINITKQEIKKEDKAIIMEGEFDVMSSFQEGIGNAVAVKGTALTESQVNLLSRFTKRISLCFDKDSAGQEAIKRSIPILEKKGIAIMVVDIVDGKDPDELAHKDPFSLKKAVKNEVGVYDFLLSQAFSRFDKSEASGKKNISDELLPFFSAIENEIVKEHYLKKLSHELDISYESITKQVTKLGSKNKQIIEEKKQDKKPRGELLEQYLLALLLQSSNTIEIVKIASKILTDYEFQALSFQKLFTNLRTYVNDNRTFDSKLFVKSLPNELLEAFDICFLFPLPKSLDSDKSVEEIEKVSQILLSLSIHARIKKLGDQIKEKEQKRETQGVEMLQKELSRIVSLLPKSF